MQEYLQLLILTPFGLFVVSITYLMIQDYRDDKNNNNQEFLNIFNKVKFK